MGRQAYFSERKRKGICLDCGDKSAPGKTRCEKDLLRLRNYASHRADERRKLGLCTYCGQAPALQTADRCLTCKLVALEKTGREWRGNKLGRAVVKKKFSPIPKADVLALWEKQDGRCAVTGAMMGLGSLGRDSISLDHVIPFAQGGSHDIFNVRFVCYLVNMMKRDLSDADFRAILGLGGLARLRGFIETPS